MIIYYERFVVIQPGKAKNAEGEPLQYMDFLTEDEYLDVLEQLPAENRYLDDNDSNKFIAKMGAEALIELLSRLDLDQLSFDLRHKANTETSQQRKTEALKRLQVIESFRDANSRIENKPEWMIIKVIPVIPPELRPLVPLDGGRFATSDLNDLYRRVIIRNNRLKRLIEIKAPEVILRNEKRMLQESVDSLFDNSRKSSAVKTESNRALKSLSDSLKGKQGRFRQNLLGKRVDYSARSVIVVGPELKMHECGLPKNMAAELFKPFVIRKMIDRGIVKTVKSAKKIIDKREPVVWDILENVMKGHPVLLNRAPTLHRLGIQAFQPVMIEGKAIRLHPLVCTAFNADFDGDQMAVHLPLGEAAVLEAQLLMLASHNILNPANGAPVTVPSQDMVLGLYYMTKPLKGAKGEGLTFFSQDEVKIAFNEGIVDLHTIVKVKANIEENKQLVNKLIETSVGRVLFNEHVPETMGFVNQLLTKKALRDVIGDVLTHAGIARTTKFLDAIKEIGYHFAFKGGLSFNLGDVIIPNEKDTMITDAYNQVDEVTSNYNMGFITNNERYNQVIDIWSNTNAHLTEKVMNQLSSDKEGFNSVYMMLDSGARGSKEQIKQLGGMRGLMAKPQKSGDKSGAAIIENPIIANFKEGLSILEYFISTHGARKGLADTALKTADAGYLTRRLVDASQDVVVKIEDCGTLRGLEITAYKKNDEIVEPLKDRIVGRVSLHDIYAEDGNLIVAADDMINERVAQQIEENNIESVEVRSVLTCEAKKGVCAKCYGRNLSTGKMAVSGDTVGVVAAQSIGEPGTQLTLRTFHFGGTASKIASESSIVTKFDGKVEIDDLKTIKTKNEDGEDIQMVISRTSEIRIIDDKLGIVLSSNNIPYGSTLHVESGKKVKKGTKICDWDPYNAVIVSEFSGTVAFNDIIEGMSFRVESDEQTGFEEKVMIERKDKTLNPSISVVNKKASETRNYSIPVKAHLTVNDDQKIKAGQIIAKIPRLGSSLGDITGGLPRVTELFEARDPSNPAIVTEIDGIVSFGPKIKRGNKEVIITSKTGQVSKYLIPLSKHLLVQENDFVKSGMPLCDGAITPSDILRIKGPTAVQEYIVNEIQEVYRLQGMKINDKHFEVVVRQMMRKMSIVDAGDTRFLDGQVVTKLEFLEENDRIFGMKIVENPGDSQILKPGQIISARKLREENSRLRRKDLKTVEVREIVPATSEQKIQGITRAALQTNSWVSAASFQETTKVLNAAAISGKRDGLEGLKENVIVGHKIPAGTGLRKFDDIIVGSNDEYNELMAMKEQDDDTQEIK